MATWEVWAPGALAFVGALGPALLAGGRASRSTARVLAFGALAAMLVLLLVDLFLGGPRTSVIDVVLGGSLVMVAAVGTRRAFAWVLVVLAALAAARGLAFVPMGLAVPTFLGAALTAAFAWAAAALLALSLAVVRLRKAAR